MTEDNKWLDEIFSRTERQEILANVKVAIKLIYSFKIRDALNVLESLHDMLEDYDVDGLLKEIEEIPRPKFWKQPDKYHYNAQTHTIEQEQVKMDVNVLAELKEELRQKMEEIQLKQLEERLLARDQGQIAERPEAPEKEMPAPWQDYIDLLRSSGE